MFAEEPRMESVHGLCCDALVSLLPLDEEKKADKEPRDEPERPNYSLPCD